MRQENKKVLAILLADIHLSLKAPVWRSAEEDWLSAQTRVLKEIRSLRNEHENCPIICAGDIFDRSRKVADGWNASAELINFALNELPDNIYAIPGQHDLPDHQYADIERSAYWTLVEAGKIKNILPGDARIVDNKLALYGFPPGYAIEKPYQHHAWIKCGIVIAVVHDYIWITGHSYPDAPKEKKIGSNSFYPKWSGYDVVVYGDNHKGFNRKIGGTIVYNCGTLMRRKSDEINYKPRVGLLMEDKSVVTHFLDTSADKYIDRASLSKAKDSSLDTKEFFDELEKLGNTALDFKDAMKEFLHRHNTADPVKRIINRAMEK
jgi:DNA repair exonuclease SbcCD nuclease subunit